MLTIGITGPTGAGKTTALRVLEEMGFAAVDCDALYYQLLRTDEGLRRQLAEAFGDIFLPGGQLDRRRLGGIVFSDPAALRRLNAIVYPAVDRAVEEAIRGCTARGLVVDAINLIESGLARRCDLTLAVTAPEAVRLRRIMERDGISEDYARRRIAAQKPDSYYRKHCGFLLENRAESRADFAAQVRETLESLLLCAP